MTYKDDLLSNYDYEIPEELIAQKPVKTRQDSRLFVVNSAEHKNFITENFLTLPKILALATAL
jgi:S-adenosylmethionine:tRNA-ribosyltransferase-isomerase (queuine synthetase)